MIASASAYPVTAPAVAELGGIAHLVVVTVKPTVNPFEYVSGHIVKSVAVGGVASYGRGVFVTVAHAVRLPLKIAATVGKVCPFAVDLLVAPRIDRRGQSARRGVFPLLLGRQALARPLGVGRSGIEGDVYYGMIGIVEKIVRHIRPTR